jgi:hypothetical protein
VSVSASPLDHPCLGLVAYALCVGLGLVADALRVGLGKCEDL